MLGYGEKGGQWRPRTNRNTFRQRL